MFKIVITDANHKRAQKFLKKHPEIKEQYKKQPTKIKIFRASRIGYLVAIIHNCKLRKLVTFNLPL